MVWDREVVTLSTLAEIHILHGDIKLDNILVSDSGPSLTITSIDFSYSYVCFDQDTKRKGRSVLLSLLNSHFSYYGD